MPDYCKHGLEMSQTCRKCGRIKVVEVPNFEAMKNGFTSSIDRLEETVRKMRIELTSAPPPADNPPDEPAASNDSDVAEPPPPPKEIIFPWQKR